jgi:hypothetical protein
MAIRNDISIDWDTSPRIILVDAPSISVEMQDLIDTLRYLESQANAMDNPQLLDAAGKEFLKGDGSLKVGLTVTLNNAQVAFEARGGPDWVLCEIAGGNVVAVEDIEATPRVYIDARKPTAYISIDRTGSSSATLIQSESSVTQVDIDNIVDGVWDETTADHQEPYTFGYDIAKKEDLDIVGSELSYTISGAGDIDVNLGSLDSGTYLDTNTHDESYMIFNETSTGYNIDFTFKTVSSEEIPRLLQFQGRYQGNPNHVVRVQAYNDESSSFEYLTSVTGSNELDSSTTDYFKEFIISRNHLNPQTREVKIKIIHSDPGSTLHDLYIDKINIITAVTSATLTEAGIAQAVWNSNVSDYTVSGIYGTEIPTDLDYLKTKADAAEVFLQFISDLESGKHVLVGNQLICYKPDNVTELIRFNLYDAGGSPTTDNVYRRDRV